MARLVLVLLALSAAACATTGAVPRPFPSPDPAPAPPAVVVTSSATGAGYAVTSTALSFRGVHYRNGGSDPSGFDCSGFVWYVFGQNGITVPRTVAEQYRAGTAVNGNGLEAGDLVFFSTTAPGPTHVGIALGGDEFVHAPSSTGEVRVERLASSYWSARYLGARRLR